jgi:hypothetical protein
MIVQSLYISRAIHPMGHTSDAEILRASRKRCRALGLTGYLFRNETHFVQVLEGAARDVWSVMADIRRDTRHHMVCEWPPRLAASRTFGTWAMGYGPIDRDDVAVLLDRTAFGSRERDAFLQTLRRIAATHG